MLNLTLKELIRAYRSKTLTPTGVVAESLSLFDKLNPELNIFLSVDRDGAMQAARAAEERLAAGDDSPLLGLPLCIPDVVNFPPLPTTYGSKLFMDNIPLECAPDLKKLRALGVVILGKTNLSEFGLDPETRNALLPPTRNPVDPLLTSGGPNGGSAAAVAAGICPIALSTDYCGSIRISSSFCKLLGFIPSHGLMPVRSEHYTPTTELRFLRKGFIAHTIEDIEALFLPMIGRTKASAEGLFRIAYSKDLGFLRVDHAVSDNLKVVVDQMRRAGHTLDEVNPEFDGSVTTHFQNIVSVDRALIIQGALDKHPEGYRLLTDCTKRWLDYAQGVSGISYAYAETYLRWLRDKVDETFRDYDFILTPVCPVPPYPVGQLPEIVDSTLVDVWSFTLPFNMSGHPAASFSGVQLVGKTDMDAHLLAAAKLLYASLNK